LQLEHLGGEADTDTVRLAEIPVDDDLHAHGSKASVSDSARRIVC
jgi:hypothetical protein